MRPRYCPSPGSRASSSLTGRRTSRTWWLFPPAALPQEALATARKVFGSNANISEFAPGSSVGEDRAVLERLLERVQRRGALYRHFLESSDFDLVVVGFYEGHKGSHRFWDYRAESQGGELARADASLSHAVRDLYEATDRELGTILDALPDDANVVALSLYGMKDEYPTTDLLDSFLRTLGYQATPTAAEPGGFSIAADDPASRPRRRADGDFATPAALGDRAADRREVQADDRLVEDDRVRRAGALHELRQGEPPWSRAHGIVEPGG